MAWAPIAAAGIQAGGSLLGGMLGAAGQSASNAQQFANQEMLFNQQQNETWALYNDQKQQANSAYQRAVADMKAAGLNPILAAFPGGAEGTASPSIGGTPSAPPVGNAGALVGQGVASAAQAGSVYTQMKALGAQTDKDKASADLAGAQKGATDAQAENTRATNANIGKEGDRIDADAASRRAAARAADAAAGASNASAAVDAVRAMTEMQRVRQEKQKADRDELQGAPRGSETGRTIQDIGGWIGNAWKSLTQPGVSPQTVAPSSARGASEIPKNYSMPEAAPYYRGR